MKKRPSQVGKNLRAFLQEWIQRMIPNKYGQTRPKTADIVEAIGLLHAIATPAVAIAKRLKVDQATVLHVIEHGSLPARQQSFGFGGELSPYDMESER